MAETCPFYYYESGYSCMIKREKEGSSSIDEDTVKRYCWGYHHSDCPRYKAKQGGNGCFLTSACVSAKGLPDDCRELTVLRSFRDGYLHSQIQGDDEIRHYYEVAPKIVEKINSLENSIQIYNEIYAEMVVPCVAYIDKGKNDDAHKLYSFFVEKLEKRYLG